MRYRKKPAQKDNLEKTWRIRTRAGNFKERFFSEDNLKELDLY
jgi:hypothetical protein